MSELNNTESQITETTASEPVEVTETVSAGKDSFIKGYQNKTSRLLNNVFVTMLVAAIVYVGFQFYLTVTSYLQQAAPLSLALLYTFATVLLPAILVLAGSFLFKFFAEVVELMDRNCK